MFIRLLASFFSIYTNNSLGDRHALTHHALMWSQDDCHKTATQTVKAGPGGGDKSRQGRAIMGNHAGRGGQLRKIKSAGEGSWG